MSGMVERIARAQYAQSNLSERPDFDAEPATVRRAFLNGARVAIEAMREPTSAMLRGYIRFKGYDPDKVAETIDEQLLGVGVVHGYQAMIDAALEDQP